MNVDRIEAWLQDHAGLDAASLGAGVVARAARDRMEHWKCASEDDYLSRLAVSVDERDTFIDRVIVPETWFFRDRPAFDVIARHLVDTWGPAHPGATYHILSLPCATGEEAYSLAIACAIAGWPLTHLRIDAVDISRENLVRARAAVYRKNSFRGDELLFRDAFFETVDRDAWRVAEPVRAPIRFEHANLMADDFAANRAPYEAIFCRNLLIYFNRTIQDRAVKTLARLLAPDGLLALGPAEPVLLFEHGFEPVRAPAAFVVRRVPPATAPTRRRVEVARPAPTPVRPVKPVAKPPPVVRVAPTPAPETAPDSLADIRALADAGRLRDAARRGEALLLRVGPSAELLYLLAVVAEANGEVVPAEEMYRKTLFLEPKHHEALVHLALLAEKKGDANAARQLRRRAQRSTGNLPVSEDPMPSKRGQVDRATL